jgi:hypothetical protein
MEYEFSANGLVFGRYQGATLTEAREAFAQDAGYTSWGAMVEQAEESGGNAVEETDCGVGCTPRVAVTVEEMAEDWLVEASDGRDWAQSYDEKEVAEEVAADIRAGVLNPWED